MDVPLQKINLAISAEDEFRFEYHHYIKSVYICSYVYALPAKALAASLNKVKSNTLVDESGSPKYRVYLDYITGILYTTYSDRKKMICQLKPVYKSTPTRLGEHSLAAAISSFNTKNSLLQLVANTAIWAPKEAVMKQDPKKFIYIRRKPSDPKKGEPVKEMCGVYYDDNTHPNRLIKAAVKQYYKFTIAPGEYAVCHIWEDTCYHAEYHTDLRNLVLLPRALASLADYDESVSNMLKIRASELFDGWHPESNTIPSMLHYSKILWPCLPTVKFK